jgi:hypothetical protein
MNHRFLLGIGSQRAGSSLLHSLLSKASSAFMHPVKELHYFDTLFEHRSQSALKDFALHELRREIGNITSTNNYSFMDKPYKCMLRTYSILAQSDIDTVDYLDLYRPLLSERSLLGETTPEYMLLNEAQVSVVKEKLGTETTILLICRDPVDRLVSAAKLFNVYHGLHMEENELTDWIKLQLSDETPWIKAQDQYNDYARAIRTYSSQFSRFAAISFHGLITHPSSVAQLISEMADIDIEIDLFVGNSKHKENNLAGTEIRDHSLLDQLYDRYKDQKSYIEDLFSGRSAVTC